jgi:hypothetical protein
MVTGSVIAAGLTAASELPKVDRRFAIEAEPNHAVCWAVVAEAEVAVGISPF